MFARIAYALSALLLGASVLSGVTYSSAMWTDSSSATTSVGAWPDWTPPLVSVADPGFVVSGAVTISATAQDLDSSVTSVTLAVRPAGGTWSDLCTTTSAPYSCLWDTELVADGTYELRATATDFYTNIGQATRAVDVLNDAGAVLDSVASPNRGTINLTGYVGNAGSGSTKLTFQYRTSPSGVWTNITGCVNLDGPSASCAFNTSALNGTYDLQLEAQRGGSTFYDSRTGIVIDNTAPAVTSFVVPSGLLVGSVSVTASATDSGGSSPAITIQYAAAGTGSWTTCGTAGSSPHACSFNSAAVSDGSYDFRARATDAAGNVATSAVETRSTANAPGSVTIVAPAAASVVTGSVQVTASTSTPRGVSSVVLEYRAGTSGAFTQSCSVTTSPYTCTWTTPAQNGSYELRARMTETTGGAQLTSATVSVTVDNSAAALSWTSPSAGATVSGPSVNLAVSAAPAVGKTIASVVFYGPSGTAGPALCTGTYSAPSGYACTWNSTSVAYAATHQLYAVLTHTDSSTATAGIVVKVDNLASSSVSFTSPAPGARISGQAAIQISVTSGAPVSNVQISAARTRGSGAASATVSCTAGAPSGTTTPYTCTWDTASIANSDYTLTASATLANGQQRTAARSFLVRNLRGQDVQATPRSSGNHANKLGSDDTLVLTFSDAVTPASVLPGWNGVSGVDIDVTFTHNASGDVISFPAARLGTITFAQDYVSSSNYNGQATMTLSSVTGADGVAVSSITLTFKVTGNPPALLASAAAGFMVWTPSSSVTDSTTGLSCATAPVTETGAADGEF